jgi:phenylalanine ammonia-lyase
MSPVTDFLAATELDCSVSMLAAFKKRFRAAVQRTADAMFYPSPTITPAEVATKLGDGSAQLYTWVRSKLDIPLHCGLKDDPLYNARQGLPTDDKKTIGSRVTAVYENLVRGEMMDMVLTGLDTGRSFPNVCFSCLAPK